MTLTDYLLIWALGGWLLFFILGSRAGASAPERPLYWSLVALACGPIVWAWVAHRMHRNARTATTSTPPAAPPAVAPMQPLGTVPEPFTQTLNVYTAHDQHGPAVILRLGCSNIARLTPGEARALATLLSTHALGADAQQAAQQRRN